MKGTEASFSYVQHSLYLVSSSINVSIFHTTWLDTFWTDMYMCIYTHVCVRLHGGRWESWRSLERLWVYMRVTQWPHEKQDGDIGAHEGHGRSTWRPREGRTGVTWVAHKRHLGEHGAHTEGMWEIWGHTGATRKQMGVMGTTWGHIKELQVTSWGTWG